MSEGIQSPNSVGVMSGRRVFADVTNVPTPTKQWKSNIMSPIRTTGMLSSIDKNSKLTLGTHAKISLSSPKIASYIDSSGDGSTNNAIIDENSQLRRPLLTKEVSNSKPDTIAKSTSSSLNTQQKIPTGLNIRIRFPEPLPLPALANMNERDIIRELASVLCMRDSETAAAIEFDELKEQQVIYGKKDNDDSHLEFRGKLVLETLPWLSIPDVSSSLSTAKIGSGGPLLSPSTLSNAGNGVLYPTAENELKTLTSTDTIPEMATHRSFIEMTSEIEWGCRSMESINENTGQLLSNNVKLTVAVSEALRHTTNAFQLGHISVAGNTPHFGPVASKNTFDSLRNIVLSSICDDSNNVNSKDPKYKSTSLLVKSIMSKLATISAVISENISLNDELLKSVIPLLKIHCRVWPHAHLTPSASELRVRSLMERLHALSLYYFSSPSAALSLQLPTSGHVATPLNARRHRRKFLAAGAKNGAAISNQSAMKKLRDHQQTVIAAEKAMLKAGSVYLFDDVASESEGDEIDGPVTPSSSTSVLSSLSLNLPAIKLTFSNDSEEAADSETKTSTALSQEALSASSLHSLHRKLDSDRDFAKIHGPLNSPIPIYTAPQSTLTPSPSTYRMLPRFISKFDQTRPGDVQPASLDRIHHSSVIRELQTNISGMTNQRREDEEHMLRCTGIQPQKSKRGGYEYISIDDGSIVHPKVYEKLYLAEVKYASEFIEERASESFAEEEAELARYKSSRTADDVRNDELKIINKVSFWDQDVDEDFQLNSNIICLENIPADSLPFSPLKEMSALTSLSNTFTVGELLSALVKECVHTTDDIISAIQQKNDRIGTASSKTASSSITGSSNTSSSPIGFILSPRGLAIEKPPAAPLWYASKHNNFDNVNPVMDTPTREIISKAKWNSSMPETPSTPLALEHTSAPVVDLFGASEGDSVEEALAMVSRIVASETQGLNAFGAVKNSEILDDDIQRLAKALQSVSVNVGLDSGVDISNAFYDNTEEIKEIAELAHVAPNTVRVFSPKGRMSQKPILTSPIHTNLKLSERFALENESFQSVAREIIAASEASEVSD